jgi:NADPH2:quinone reductase
MHRAWMCHELSDDLSGLRLDERESAPCGSGDVRLRVHAAALNFPDLLMARGLYQHKPTLPYVAGMECAGVAVEVGAAVRGIAVGDRLCFSAHEGAFCEERVAPAGGFRHQPAGFDAAEAAAYGVTAITAWVALVRRGALQAGETLLVHGASGGTGLAAVQLGRHLGATVIATGRSADTLQGARDAGAQHLVVLDDLKRLREQVFALTGGAGADVVFDPVGGDLFDATLRCLAWGARVLVVGFASGRIPTLPVNLPLIKGFALIGVRDGEYGRRDPVRGAQNRQAVHALAAQGVFRPLIGARFGFEQLPDALRALAGRAAAGKIVLDIQK